MSRLTSPVDVQRQGTLDRQAVQWLCPAWLARGVLTLVDGDPGVGWFPGWSDRTWRIYELPLRFLFFVPPESARESRWAARAFFGKAPGSRSPGLRNRRLS